MKQIDRNMVREMLVPFLIGQGAIVLMLIGSVLYNNATVFLENQVPIHFIVRIVLFFIPFLVHMTMPVAMAVAASLAVSRLGRDSEITVMRAAGVSLVRIFMPVFVVGAMASVGDFMFGEFVVPMARTKMDSVIGELPNHLPRLQPQAGQWLIAPDNAYAIYVSSMIPKRGYIELNRIVITSAPKALYNGESAPIYYSAVKGKYQNGNWTLSDAILFTPTADGRDVKASSPRNTTLRIVVDPKSFQAGFQMQLPMYTMAGNLNKTLRQMNQELLRKRIDHVKDVVLEMEANFKLSIPFSCMVMALCCPPLALKLSKGGGYMGVLLSICLVFVYWNMMLLAKILGTPPTSGGVPLLSPMFAAWSQNVIFVLIGIWALRKSE